MEVPRFQGSFYVNTFPVASNAFLKLQPNKNLHVLPNRIEEVSWKEQCKWWLRDKKNVVEIPDKESPLVLFFAHREQ